VLFCSDGNIDRVVDDVAEAGADGFIIEPWCNLNPIVEKYGEEKVIIGNADLKVLTFKVPEDVAVDAEGMRKEISAKDLPTKYSIFDIGMKSADRFAKAVKDSKTIVLNGPLGVYEKEPFLAGTKKVFTATADSKAYSLVGGGHTIAAIEKLGLSDRVSYVSTGGKVLLDLLMGKSLAGVEALKKSAKKFEAGK